MLPGYWETCVPNELNRLYKERSTIKILVFAVWLAAL